MRIRAAEQELKETEQRSKQLVDQISALQSEVGATRGEVRKEKTRVEEQHASLRSDLVMKGVMLGDIEANLQEFAQALSAFRSELESHTADYATFKTRQADISRALRDGSNDLIGQLTTMRLDLDNWNGDVGDLRGNRDATIKALKEVCANLESQLALTKLAVTHLAGSHGEIHKPELADPIRYQFASEDEQPSDLDQQTE